MAAKKKQSENRTPPEPGSLEAAISSAFDRLIAHEGSISAAARVLREIAPSLKLPRQRLSRWLVHGIPKGALGGEVLEALLFALYSRFAALDRSQPVRDARDRKMAKNRAAKDLLVAFSDRRERKRLVETVRGWVRRHGEVAKFRGLKQSGAQRFALELGVSPDLVRRAIAPGRESMGVKLYLALREFEAKERALAIEDEINRQKMVELMELASVPATYTRMVPRVRRRKLPSGEVVRKTVMVAVEYEEPVIPKVPNGDWEFGGAGTYGRRWGRTIGRFLSPRIHPSGSDGWAVVEEFVRFARRVPGLSPAERYPQWSVYLLASQIGDEKVGSNPQYRDLDHDDDNRFAVGEAFNGGNFKGARARERAIEALVAKIGVVLDVDSVLVYLHGGIAWNFRVRTAAEKERREKRFREDREFEQTLREIQARVEKADAERRKKRARRAKRKVTLAGVMARRQQRKKKR